MQNNNHVVKTNVKVGGVIITVTNDGQFSAADVSVLIQNAYAIYNRVVEVAQDVEAPLPHNDVTIWEQANKRFESARTELPTDEVVSVWTPNVPLTMFALSSVRTAIDTLRGAYDAIGKIAPAAPQNAPNSDAGDSPRTNAAPMPAEGLFSAKVIHAQNVIQVTRNKAVIPIDIATRPYDYKDDTWMVDGREYAYPVTLIKRQDNGRIMFGFANDMGIFSVFPPKPDDKYPDKTFLNADALLGADGIQTFDGLWLVVKRKLGKNGKHYTNAVNLYQGDVPHPATDTPAPQAAPALQAAPQAAPAAKTPYQQAAAGLRIDIGDEAPLAHDPNDIPF